ncbi:hypothetical protein [Acinetobacter sp. YH12071]|uniref:hypothetical protein n=1 Tax=Acinetobacter sp. YH12071 TaxID=2601067 RepID=UPI0015D1D58E|nr:hypothetical protein [Acinetobacter sp. YH12071]
MKKFIFGLTLFLPIISNAQPKWELADVFITNKDKGEISKLYVDTNSIKQAKNNSNIRYFSIKEVHSNPKNNVVVNNIGIECSQGLLLSSFTNKWEPIFQRGYIIGTLKTYQYYSYTTVCDDVRGKYANNIIIDTNKVGF